MSEASSANRKSHPMRSSKATLFRARVKSILFTESTFRTQAESYTIDETENHRRATKFADRRKKRSMPTHIQEIEIRKLLKARVSGLRDHLINSNPGGRTGGLLMSLALYYSHVLQGDKIANLSHEKRVALLEELRSVERKARALKATATKANKFKVRKIKNTKGIGKEVDGLEKAFGKLGLELESKVLDKKDESDDEENWEDVKIGDGKMMEEEKNVEDGEKEMDMDTIGVSLAEVEVQMEEADL
ncbi:MAG: hypothetical protein MMC33_010811 [Icmadophila ericetorum]|nr:hypothetical protein [Icmadophila ericetorum]